MENGRTERREGDQKRCSSKENPIEFGVKQHGHSSEKPFLSLNCLPELNSDDLTLPGIFHPYNSVAHDHLGRSKNHASRRDQNLELFIHSFVTHSANNAVFHIILNYSFSHFIIYSTQ